MITFTKKQNSRLVAIAVCIAMLLSAFAVMPVSSYAVGDDSFTDGWLTYTVLTESGSTGTVSVGWTPGWGNDVIDPTIPGTVEHNDITYTVTKIGDRASDDRTIPELKGILTIPDTVTHIGADAFFEYDGLTGDLIIPDSVTYIGPGAFYYCPGFTGDLIIPGSVQSIGRYAFYAMAGINGDIAIPDSVDTIGLSAFARMTNITSIKSNIKDFTGVDPGAFGIEGFSIKAKPLYCPASLVQKHENYGFLDVNAVYGVGESFAKDDLTFTILTQDNEAKTGTVSVKATDSYEISGQLNIPKTVEKNGVTYTVTEIADRGFENALGLSGSLIIPDSVQTIGGRAFNCCYGFTGDLVIPNSVRTIGRDAFYTCLNLNGELTIGNRVQTIENYAFTGCYNLTGDLIIPDSVTSIGVDAFADLSGLTETKSNIKDFTGVDPSAFGIGANDIKDKPVICAPELVYIHDNYGFEDVISKDFTPEITATNGVTTVKPNETFEVKVDLSSAPEEELSGDILAVT
ncbi:MAG: leucine-rich repeat domain-containing protein, partial [Clostridiales Family XIII bacterium]|nr:leucine-rich repeat domain-containing protein [Clostridiales Family XIII bacterium]